MADNTQQTRPVGQPVLVGLSKRQQLDKTNRNIFIWVAVAAAVLSLSIVALQFLVREGIFNQEIINRKSKAEKTLQQNLASVEELKQNVDALLANDSLTALRINPTDSALQVILDALPTTGDSTTFSNSLYSKVLSRNGVAISNVTVGDIQAAGLAAAPAELTTDATASGTASVQPLKFSVSFTGNQDQIKATMADIERTIRPINVQRLNVRSTEGALGVTVDGETYFLPRSTVEVRKEQVKP